jgi:hypothetical protein
MEIKKCLNTKNLILKKMMKLLQQTFQKFPEKIKKHLMSCSKHLRFIKSLKMKFKKLTKIKKLKKLMIKINKMKKI